MPVTPMIALLMPDGSRPVWVGTAPGYSWLEHVPAQAVPQPLIVEDQVADPHGQSIALPCAFPPTGLDLVDTGACRLHRPDPVGRGTQLVSCHVRRRCRLRRGLGRVPGRATEVPRCRVGVARGRSRLGHRDLSPRPGTHELERVTRSIVSGSLALEQRKDMVGAVGGPKGEQVVVGITQRSAATDRDEARIALLGQDHRPDGAPISRGALPWPG